MVLVSGGATSPAISTLKDDGRVFRTVASDAIQGEVSADRIAELKITTASILYRDDAWGRGLAAVFQSSFEARGGKILASVPYPEDSTLNTDFSSYLDAAFADKPGAVLLAAFEEAYGIGPQIDSGAYLEGYAADEPKLVGTDGFFTSDLVVNMPPSVLDRLIGTIPRSNPESADYKAAQKLVGVTSGDADLDGARFDALTLIALAIQAAEANDAGKIRAVLQEISRKDAGDVEIHVGDWKKARETLLAGGTINYEGASGAIELDDNGDRSVGWIGFWKFDKNGSEYTMNDSEIVAYGE
jgi:branched-chain amino acid transport system substrate-binding protein